MDIISSTLLSSLKDWCRNHPIRLCVLFGSQVTGKAHPSSDVDLAVWPTEALPLSAKLHWIYELETLLNQEVNLVEVSANLDPVLAMEICRHGRLVYEQKPESWLHHRWQLWHIYNDSRPFLRAEWQRLHKFAQRLRNGA